MAEKPKPQPKPEPSARESARAALQASMDRRYYIAFVLAPVPVGCASTSVFAGP